MLRIVTDGAADLPPEWEKQYDIRIVPINIQFGDKTYLQYADLDNEGFYRLVDETKKIPKTSQPSPHQFAEFYKKIAQPGDTILSIHVTSKLSGTYASAVAAAAEVKGTYDVRPFDSESGSACIGFMCREARVMERAGASVGQILARLEAVRAKSRIILALDTLEYARMSGRIGTLQAAMASALNVKPIALLKDGVLNMIERVRTRRASLDRIVQLMQEEFGRTRVDIAVVQARDPQAGRELMERVRGALNVRDLIMTDLSISVAANLGPGTVGLVIYPMEG